MNDLFNIEKTRLPKDTREALKKLKGGIDNFNLKLNKAAYLDDDRVFKGQREVLPWEKRKFVFAKYERNAQNSRVLLPYFGAFEETQTLREFSNNQMEIAEIVCGKENVFELILNINWRLAVGLGHESVYETAITLHHIYGIPYIPASSVKGVLRSFMIQDKYRQKSDSEAIAMNKEQLLCDLFGCAKETSYEIDNEDCTKKIKKKTKSYYAANTNVEEKQGDLVFFDVFPITRPIIEPDVMNPHYPEYYSGKQLPTDYQNPIPINFLTVKDTTFRFIVGVKGDNKIHQVAGSEFKNELGKTELEIAKEYLLKALTLNGIGAKTSVGYGYMKQPSKKLEQTVLAKEQPIIQEPTGPQFLQKGPFKPGKRYQVEGIVTKSGRPNFVSVYVKDGLIQENVRLDKATNPLDEGTVIKIEADINAKDIVLQASFVGVKK